MKAYLKIAIFAFLGVILAGAATVILVSDQSHSQFIDNQKIWLEQGRTAGRYLIENLNEQLSENLSAAIENQTKSDFLAVGLLQQSLDANQRRASLWRSSNELLTDAWINSQINQLPLERVLAGSVSWVRLTQPDQQPVLAYLMLIEVQGEAERKLDIAVGLLPMQVLSQINTISKAKTTALFVVNSAGFALSYPDQQYVGSKIENHPVVSRFSKSIEAEGVGTFRISPEQAIVGAFENIPNTNLYIVTTAPILTKTQARTQSLLQAALPILGFALIMGVILGFLAHRQSQANEVLLKNLQLMGANRTESPPNETIHINTDKLKPFARSVSDYLRDPLTAVVGHAQILQTKQTDSRLKDAADRLIIEARKTRDFVEGLNKVSQGSETINEIFELTPLISQIATIFRGELAKNNILLEENIKADLKLRGDFLEVKEAFKTLIKWSIEMLASGHTQKKITLNVESLGGLAQIAIQVKGAELSADIRRKIFQPFAVNLSSSEILGLDLALAHRHIAHQNGELNLESITLDHFVFIARLPLAVNSVISKNSEPMLKPVEQELIAKLPPPPDSKTIAVPAPAPVASAMPPPTPAANSIVSQPNEIKNEMKIEIRRPKVRLDP